MFFTKILTFLRKRTNRVQLRLSDWVVIMRGYLLPVGLCMSLFTVGCTPSVRILPPQEPIEINVNLRIDQEVTVRLVDNDQNKNLAQSLGIFDAPSVMP